MFRRYTAPPAEYVPPNGETWPFTDYGWMNNATGGDQAPTEQVGSSLNNAGSFFVAFEDPARSMYANRPHWALSVNTDTLDEQLHRPMALMRLRIDATGSGTTDFDITSGYIWCGDTSDTDPDTFIKVLDGTTGRIDYDLAPGGIPLGYVPKVTDIRQGGSSIVGNGIVAASVGSPITIRTNVTVPLASPVRIYCAGRDSYATSTKGTLIRNLLNPSKAPTSLIKFIGDLRGDGEDVFSPLPATLAGLANLFTVKGEVTVPPEHLGSYVIRTYDNVTTTARRWMPIDNYTKIWVPFDNYNNKVAGKTVFLAEGLRAEATVSAAATGVSIRLGPSIFGRAAFNAKISNLGIAPNLGSSGVSISAWVYYFSDTATYGGVQVVSLESSGTKFALALPTPVSANDLVHPYAVINGSNYAQVTVANEHPYTVQRLQWSLISTTYDGTTVRTYMNGVFLGTGTVTYSPPWTTGSWLIGACATNYAICDVRLDSVVRDSDYYTKMYRRAQGWFEAVETVNPEGFSVITAGDYMY